MSGVVLRCPNCGTTRVAPGLCEACHEADVRYYCTNHTPGQWLEARACPQCGARFGDPARPPGAPAPAARARTGPAPAPAPAPPPHSTLPPRPPRYSPAGRREESGRPTDRRERLPPDGIEEFDPRDERVARAARWQEILRATTRARRVPREPSASEFEAAPAGRGLGGCLLRLVLVVMLLFLALAIAPFLFGSLLFQLF